MPAATSPNVRLNRTTAMSRRRSRRRDVSRRIARRKTPARRRVGRLMRSAATCPASWLARREAARAPRRDRRPGDAESVIAAAFSHGRRAVHPGPRVTAACHPRHGPATGGPSGSRPQANDETSALTIRDATGIFLTGGNQLRLSSTIGGTRLADAILERFRHGAVVAGTSAGASAMSSHMIAFGASGATPKHRMAQVSAGLGLLPGVIVDQHFQQRNRLGRLLSVIAQNPSLLGLGVDEDTAGVVGPDHILEVIGRGSITVVDGSTSETDAWEIKGHRPLMISGVILHSLPSGYRFDLRHRHRIATPALHALQGGAGGAAA